MPTSTLTPEQIAKLHEMLSIDRHPHLARGLGTVAEPCTLAAVNLALTGVLTDNIPSCMSLRIGRFLVRVQDACPADLGRDHPRWRAAMVSCVGSGRDAAREAVRARLMVEWVWRKVLPVRQAQADASGFGPAWAAMCTATGGRAAARSACAAARAHSGDMAPFGPSAEEAWVSFDLLTLVEALGAS